MKAVPIPVISIHSYMVNKQLIKVYTNNNALFTKNHSLLTFINRIGYFYADFESNTIISHSKQTKSKLQDSNISIIEVLISNCLIKIQFPFSKKWEPQNRSLNSSTYRVHIIATIGNKSGFLRT